MEEGAGKEEEARDFVTCEVRLLGGDLWTDSLFRDVFEGASVAEIAEGTGEEAE